MIPSINRTHSTQVTFLAAVVLLSVAALPMAFTGSAAAAVDTADRDISSTEVTNGSVVTVTIDGATSGSAEALEITDTISNTSGSAPASSDVSVAAPGATVSTYSPSSGSLSASYGPGSETVSYDLTIPEGVPEGTNYTLSGSVSDGRNSTPLSGPDTIEVVIDTSTPEESPPDDSPPEESPSGDGSIVTADRDIESPEALAGDTVEVTVTAGFDGTVSKANIRDTIGFKPDSDNVTDIDAPDSTISSYSESSGEVVASWGSTTGENLSYTVKIPTDASAGTTFTFSGEVENGETTSTVGGNSTIEVVTDPLITYADSDNIIRSEGLITAAGEFRSGKIDGDTLIDVAEAFRSGKPV